MRAAEVLWRDRGAPAFGLRADNTLRVDFSATSTEYRGLYDDEPGIVYINKKVAGPQLHDRDRPRGRSRFSACSTCRPTSESR